MKAKKSEIIFYGGICLLWQVLGVFTVIYATIFKEPFYLLLAMGPIIISKLWLIIIILFFKFDNSQGKEKGKKR